MRAIQKLLFAVGAFSFAAAAAASPGAPQAGAEYLTLPEAQNTDAGAKVEVIEFFAYSCPHCFSFDPLLAEWVRKNADKIVFKRVHVAFNAGDAPLQRLYVTTEAMGLSDKTHAKVFSSIHDERHRISSDEAVFDWAEKNGIPREQFIATYRSFGIQARVNRSQGLIGAYQIEQWPMLAVGGRYLTSPYLATSTMKPAPAEPEQQKIALQVMDQLVAKAKADKK